MKKRWLLIVLSLFSFTTSSNIYASPSVADLPNGIHVVAVTAKGYRYEMPVTLSAGPTLFKFTDDGPLLHQMEIVKFLHGKTLADFTSRPPGPPPAWAVFLGGPNSPMPHGGKDADIVNLTPGHYAAMCFIPGPDGKPHWMNGMVKSFSVTPSQNIDPAPKNDLTLTLVDYSFRFSSHPTKGRHIIRIINKGTQLHEAELFRLRPGKNGKDVLKWVESGMKGPPPGLPVTGIAGEAPKKVNYLETNFKPGSYALLCFLPSKNGKMHAQLGMILNFKI